MGTDKLGTQIAIQAAHYGNVVSVYDKEEWVKSLNCAPLMVNKEVLGFCFNRVWRAIKKECLHMWGEGYVDFKDID